MAGWSASWSYTAPEPLQQASIAGGVVYASGDGTSPQDGNIYAFDAQTGSLLWRQHLNNMSMTTPVVARGMVFVGSGNQSFTPQQQARVNILNTAHDIRGTGPSAVYALNAQTGAVLWQFSTPGEDMPSFVYNHRTLYVANGNGKVYAFDARTGTLEWELTIGSYVSMSSPVLVGNLLYVSGAHPYNLYAINVATHKLAWSVPVPHVFAGSDDSSLSYSGGRIFIEGTVGSWTKPYSVAYAFSAASGQLLWSRTLGTGLLPTDIEVAAPVAVKGTVYVGSPITNQEVALNAATGQVLWSFKAIGPVSESAAVVHGQVYVGDAFGMMYALNAQTGRLVAVRKIGGVLAADFPIIVGNTLYQANENGQMDALPLSDWNPQIALSAPAIPTPKSGKLAKAILAGQKLFMGTSLSSTGLSCNSCHTGGGTLTSYLAGHEVPDLIGAASGFPKLKKGKLMTLDAQINHCLRRAQMKGPTLAVSDKRLLELNLYLHWLSSGFPEHLFGSSAKIPGGAAGCK